MASTHREVENKYSVAEDVVLPSLEQLPGVVAVAAPVEHELDATYFDTPDLRLAAVGITLRRRTGGDDAGWHLKLPSAGARDEVRLPLGRGVKTVPSPFRKTLRGVVRDARLAPVAIVRTRRTVRRLLDRDGRVLAEVADDRVSATDQNTAAATGWREWEVELVDGDHALLEAAADLLGELGAEPSRAPSKLARALDGRIPRQREAPQRKLSRKVPAGDVVQARLAEQVTELRRLDPRVRRDDPDAVHKMRVAIRRLRGALATFRPLLDREVTEPLRGELTWLGGVLGGARDAEVMRERLGDMLRAEAPGVVRGDVADRIDRELQAEYSTAHARSVEAMDSDRYLALLDRVEALAAAAPMTELARKPASRVLPGRVRHDWKRLRRRVTSALEVEDRDERARRLHQARKAARRARYAAEPLRALYGKDARAFVAETKRIQSVLGEHHDSIVTQARLRQLADRAAADCGNAFTFGVLHVREDAAAARSEAKFAGVWRSASRKKLRAWLS